MKSKLAILGLCVVALLACNKEKRKMKGLVGNWTIEQSERAIIYSDGSEDIYDDITDAGKVVISENPDDDSGETNLFTFDYEGYGNDTMHIKGILSTDEKKRRLVFENALCDSGNYCNVIWTVDKSKKNKQVWSAYGVDSTFFYPSNKFNPGSADNWLMWRITLKRQR